MVRCGTKAHSSSPWPGPWLPPETRGVSTSLCIMGRRLLSPIVMEFPVIQKLLCGRVLGAVDERGCLERSARRFLFLLGPYVSNGLRPESTVRLIRVVCVWGL